MELKSRFCQFKEWNLQQRINPAFNCSHQLQAFSKMTSCFSFQSVILWLIVIWSATSSNLTVESFVVSRPIARSAFSKLPEKSFGLQYSIRAYEHPNSAVSATSKGIFRFDLRVSSLIVRKFIRSVILHIVRSWSVTLHIVRSRQSFACWRLDPSLDNLSFATYYVNFVHDQSQKAKLPSKLCLCWRDFI